MLREEDRSVGLVPGHVIWTAALGILLVTSAPPAEKPEATAASPCQAEIVVDFDGSSEEGQPVAAVAMESVSGASVGQSTSLEVPDRRRISWPAGDGLRVEARAEGYWSPPKVLRCSSEPGLETVRLRLHPTGDIRGRVQVPEDSVPPERIEIHFEPSPSPTAPAEDLPEGQVDCALEDNGGFSCEVPRGSLDLRFRHPGFAAAYRWGVEVEGSETNDLGRIELVPGASMVGFVVVEGVASPGDVWVELRPETAGREAPAVRQRLDALELHATPDERGFFQFRHVPPGTYRLRAGAESFVPVALSPIRVVEGKESALRDPLRLEPPVAFHLVVSPAAPPTGEAWSVSLDPLPDASGISEGGFRGTTDGAGNWSRHPVAPGTYHLTVESEQGRWARREVLITGLSPFLEITLDAIEVTGVVRSGDTPVEAVVWLGDRHGEERIRVETDSGGDFEVALPRPGKWPVALTLEDSEQYVGLDPVRVEATETGEAPRLDLEIPDTRIAGEVVDGRGEPVEDATVRFVSREGRRDHTRVKSGEDGRYEALGLPPGTYWASAELPDPSSPIGRAGSSDAVLVDVAESEPEDDVRLVLHRFLTVRGRVVSPAGPVSGARVTVRAETAAAFTPGPLEDAVTGPTGTFHAQVPEHAVALSVVVVPPGYAARIVRIPLEGRREVQIPVSETGGAVRLDLETWDHSKPPHLHAGGTWAPLFTLQPRQVPTADGVAWILPRMAPGTYVLCTGTRVTEACSQGTLPPGGELTLQGPARNVKQDSR